MSAILVASKVVTPGGVLSPGWVRCDGEIITEVGVGRADSAGRADSDGRTDRAEVRDLGDVIIVPGFVDVHVHGGGGASYTDVGRDSAAPAFVSRDAHLARGTTSTMASLVAAEPAVLIEQVRALSPLVAAGELRGIHLEGPWLSPARKGAHAESALRAPDQDEIDALLEIGGGSIAMVTIAPELPGALRAIERFVSAGVVVAIGHTDTDYGGAREAIDAGVTVATHLFNAMPPLLHRAPGPVLALLRDERVVLELVADGVHLDREIVAWVEEIAGPDRVMFVTDAMAAATSGDGAYRLGELDVDVAGGVARLAGTGTIAGSTATMDGLFRARAILSDEDVAAHSPHAAAGVVPPTPPRYDDASLAISARLTSTNPARAMGWTDLGAVAAGKRADLVVLDRTLTVREVIRAGRLVGVA